MKYKLLLLDIDGTLRPGSCERVPKENAEAVCAVQKAGVKIAIATGRGRIGVGKGLLRSIRPDYWVCAGGAQLVDYKGADLALHRLTTEEMYALVDFFEDYDLPLRFTYHDANYAYLGYEEFARREREKNLALNIVDGEDQDKHLEEMPFGAFGFLSQEMADRFQEKYGYLGLNFLFSYPGSDGCDILQQGIDKGAGLRELAKLAGIDSAGRVAVGGGGIPRPNRTGLPTTLIRSYWELGDILHFEPATARRNIELGYHDTLRAFGRLRGCAYAVDSGAESSADAAAFHAAFEAVQKDMREKHPSTLTADAALLLAKLSDAELAPLEAVAEDVGVDPAPYYTTRTLGEAFLAKCDFERLRSFEPLFEGEAGPAQAARAALLPNTFLQALVCRALTGRVPPEEMET